MSNGLRRPFHESQLRRVLPAEELSVRPAAAADAAYLQQFSPAPDPQDARSLHLIGVIGSRRVGLLSLRDEDDGSLAMTLRVSPLEVDSGIGNRILQKASDKTRHICLSVTAWREAFRKLAPPAAPKPPNHRT